MGDEIADELLEYAVFLAQHGRGDTVRVEVIGADGDEVTATFRLGPGVTMMAETANTRLPEPDSQAALDYLAQARRGRAEGVSSTVGDGTALPGYDDMFDVGTDDMY